MRPFVQESRAAKRNLPLSFLAQIVYDAYRQKHIDFREGAVCIRKALLICNAVFPYMTALCPVLMGLFPPAVLLLALLALLAPVLLALNAVWLYRRLQAPVPVPETGVMLIIKLVQIPAFVISFLVGMFTVAFIALPLFLLLLNAAAVGLTGLISVGNAVLLYRKGRLSRASAVVLGVLSFVFCLDAAAAVILWWLGRRPAADGGSSPGFRSDSI